MNDNIFDYPEAFHDIRTETTNVDFNQVSDEKFGPLLSTLCASKQGGKFLELGTGSGLSTSWILSGMCSSSTLVTVDSEASLVAIAKKHLGHDNRVRFVVGMGEVLVDSLENDSFDLIFADTWPGKYFHVEETLDLLKTGGIYIIDDMRPQTNWPEGHHNKAESLVKYLSQRKNFTMSKLNWSTGIIICTKI